jgi:branched-chain amino acid transport system ATP-binding protein
MLPIVVDLIHWARTTLGASVLLVEQYSALALSVASYGYVLRTGRVVLEGPSKELQAGDSLQRAYLSHSDAEAGVR